MYIYFFGLPFVAAEDVTGNRLREKGSDTQQSVFVYIVTLFHLEIY